MKIVCQNCGADTTVDFEVVHSCKGRLNGCCNCSNYARPPCGFPKSYRRAKGYIDTDGHIVTFPHIVGIEFTLSVDQERKISRITQTCLDKARRIAAEEAKEKPAPDLWGQHNQMVKLAQDNGLHLAANWAVNMSGRTFSENPSKTEDMVGELGKCIKRIKHHGTDQVQWAICGEMEEIIRKLEDVK